MAQQSWTNVTIHPAGSFAPNATGWDISALPQFTKVVLTAVLQLADIADPTLTIETDLEFTNDVSGATGWTLLSGQTYQAGPTGRDHTAKQPSPCQYVSNVWPPMKRLRFKAIPSRDVSGVDALAVAT